jgi:hypothetical protein
LFRKYQEASAEQAQRAMSTAFPATLRFAILIFDASVKARPPLSQLVNQPNGRMIKRMMMWKGFDEGKEL